MNTTAQPSPSALEGGCLCGAVRYRYTGDKRTGYRCHCRMCQLAVGNVSASFINVRRDAVQWLKGAPTQYASSAFATRGFCARCGSPLTFAFNDSENMDLTVGSLDDPSSVSPTGHFGVETRVPNWHVADGLEELRADAYEALNERWKKHYGDAAPGVDTIRQGGSGGTPPG